MKTRERFMGILQAIAMPLFFASNALYPIEMMPAPLQAFSRVNPLTYVIQALRNALVYSSRSRASRASPRSRCSPPR